MGPVKPYTPSEFATEVTSAEVMSTALSEKRIVLVDFYGENCPPCKRLKPMIHAIADYYGGVVGVLLVNVSQFPDLAEEYKIGGIPDVRLFVDGEQTGRWLGLKNETTYTGAIESLLTDEERGAIPAKETEQTP